MYCPERAHIMSARDISSAAGVRKSSHCTQIIWFIGFKKKRKTWKKTKTKKKTLMEPIKFYSETAQCTHTRAIYWLLLLTVGWKERKSIKKQLSASAMKKKTTDVTTYKYWRCNLRKKVSFLWWDTFGCSRRPSPIWRHEEFIKIHWNPKR